jgi:hypothetical protein
MQRIQRFHEVVPFLKKNCLVVCDLDYTLVDYGKPFVEFLKETSYAEAYAYKAYDSHIHTHRPRLTDSAGFIHLMKEVLHKGKLIFVTCRHPDLEAFTRKEFKTLNLDYDFFEFHYLDGGSKGEFCHKYLKSYDQIILIDDYKKNIRSFQAFVPDGIALLFRG